MTPKVMIFVKKSFRQFLGQNNVYIKSSIFTLPGCLLACFFFFLSFMAFDQFVIVLNVDSVLRNDTTRVIQPEVINRYDILGQTSSNTIAGSSNNAIDQRKGSVAIGQSVYYTDYPPQDYGNSGELNFNTALMVLFNTRLQSISMKISSLKMMIVFFSRCFEHSIKLNWMVFSFFFSAGISLHHYALIGCAKLLSIHFLGKYLLLS